MANYSIAEVEHLTGIQAHTLRIWERRYDLVKAKRTDTKIRYYSDEQLKLLLNVSVLLNSGFKISKIDKMGFDEIKSQTQRVMLSHDEPTGSEIQALVMGMLTLDEGLFLRTYRAFQERNGLVKTITELLYPFLAQVGILWGTNKAMPAQEHLISNIIRRKILAEIDALPDPSETAEKAVLFLPEGDYHEIGLLLSYYLFRQAGMRVYYLGQCVPAADVINTVKMTGANHLMTLILIEKKDYNRQVHKILDEVDATLVLAGNVRELKEREGVVSLSRPEDLTLYINDHILN